MNQATWKALALSVALALSPALASAQATPGTQSTPGTMTPPSSDQTTKSTNTPSDLTAYQKERAACDKKDAVADQDACRNAVDQKFNKKPMGMPQGQTSAPQSQTSTPQGKAY